MSARPVAPAAVPSPCISVCRMTPDGVCEGCLRTLDEIARWGGMTDAQKLQVWRELRARRPSGSGPDA